MAITAATKLGDFTSGYLTPEMAAPIFNLTFRSSVAQQLMRQVPLGPLGVNIPVVTGRPTASWVLEGGVKPGTNTSIGLKTMTPKKVGATAVVSAETVRANPGNFMELIRNQLAEAIAIAFDNAVFHGTNTPFAGYLDQTTKAIELGAESQANGSVYRDFVDGLQLVVADTSAITGADPSPVRRKVNGIALDSVVEPSILGVTDTTGRPLFVDMEGRGAPPVTDRTLTNGRLLGRPTLIADYVATDDVTTVVGYMGDFSQAVWGVTAGINFRVTDQAAVTINGQLVSCFENNLVAILVEAEYGFLINDLKSFVRVTNKTGS